MDQKPLILIVAEDRGLDAVVLACDVRSTRSQREEFDLILFDADEAADDAAERLASLRGDHPRIPILVVGDDPGPRRVAGLVRAGASDWVPRPIDPDELRGQIENTLLANKLQRQGRHVLDYLEDQSRQVEEDRRLLNRRITTMGAQLEMANVQLAAAHRELQGKVAQLVMLYRIGRDLSNQRNWDEALGRFLRSLREFLHASGAGLLLTSGGGKVLRPRRIDGLDEATLENATRLLTGRPPEDEGEPYLVPLEEYGSDSPVPCVDRIEPWSTTVLPLRHHDEDLGFLLIEKDYASGRDIGDDVYFLITVQTILTEEVAGAQAITELRKLQSFQQRTLNQVESGIVTLDAEGRLLYANRKGAELLGEPALGEILSPALRMGGESIDLMAWAEQAQRGSPVVGEAWLMSEGAEAVPVSLQASQMASETPEKFHTIFILEDQRATWELEAERRRAARQDDLLIMAAEWAHDVRTPLTGILHSAELLWDALDEKSPKRRHFEVVRAEVDRIDGLVSNFLDFARPARLKREAVDLQRLSQEVVELLAESGRERDLQLELSASEETLPKLTADGDQLKQVLLNLVTNALDASPKGSTVLLRLLLESDDGEGSRPPGRVLVLEVEDAGSGVSAEHVERLFIPFFTTKPEGTGLGLAISEKIIRAHHGHLRYERRGERTIMRAVLPVSVSGLDVNVEAEEPQLEARG